MKLTKLSLIAALLIGSSAFAEETSGFSASANMAITSNYVWRGMSQTQNSPATQGGIDLSYEGLYLGVWGSNVSGYGAKTSMEADIYAGYAGEAAGIGYDIGFIQFAYPNNTDAMNFGEAYFGLSYDFDVVAVSAKYSMGVDTNNFDDGITPEWEPTDSIEVGLSIPLPGDISLDATYGDFTDFGTYYSACLSKSVDKFDISIAYTGITADETTALTVDQDNIVATVGTSF